jgi:hypothetical protein
MHDLFPKSYKKLIKQNGNEIIYSLQYKKDFEEQKCRKTLRQDFITILRPKL